MEPDLAANVAILSDATLVSTRIGWNKLVRPGPFRWSHFTPLRAARVALGVVLPIVVGWVTGNVEYGTYMALGALSAGFASFQGEGRSRVAAVGLASVGMAVSTFVGATSAAVTPWLLAPIIALWGYATGLSVCLGSGASVAVLQRPSVRRRPSLFILTKVGWSLRRRLRSPWPMRCSM